MKAIINGYRYNTETATEIGYYSNGRGSRDFRGYYETLYRTQNGRYFLAGSGGPMTKYARPCGDMYGGGEGIFNLTETEAYEWAEDHLSPEDVEKHFGDNIKDA